MGEAMLIIKHYQTLSNTIPCQGGLEMGWSGFQAFKWAPATFPSLALKNLASLSRSPCVFYFLLPSSMGHTKYIYFLYIYVWMSVQKLWEKFHSLFFFLFSFFFVFNLSLCVEHLNFTPSGGLLFLFFSFFSLELLFSSRHQERRRRYNIIKI